MGDEQMRVIITTNEGRYIFENCVELTIADFDGRLAILQGKEGWNISPLKEANE